MAWIESHQELGRHPKTKRFARLAGISLPQAVGHLHYLWWWVLDYAQDGDITQWDAADIADAMLWEEEPATLISALVEAKFIDHDGVSMHIHDWLDYAGKLVGYRKKDAERKRTARGRVQNVPNSPQSIQGNSSDTQSSPTDIRRTPAGHPAKIQHGPADIQHSPQDIVRTSCGHPSDGAWSPPVTVTVTEPNRTEQNQTVPYPTEPITAHTHTPAHGSSPPNETPQVAQNPRNDTPHPHGDKQAQTITQPAKQARSTTQSAKQPTAKLTAKTQYAQFVSMTNDEYASLVAKLGVDGAMRCVEILDNYKGANGKKYKSDYHAILNWVIKRHEEEQAHKQTQNQPRAPTDRQHHPQHHPRVSADNGQRARRAIAYANSLDGE